MIKLYFDLFKNKKINYLSKMMKLYFNLLTFIIIKNSRFTITNYIDNYCESRSFYISKKYIGIKFFFQMFTSTFYSFMFYSISYIFGVSYWSVRLKKFENQFYFSKIRKRETFKIKSKLLIEIMLKSN